MSIAALFKIVRQLETVHQQVNGYTTCRIATQWNGTGFSKKEPTTAKYNMNKYQTHFAE